MDIKCMNRIAFIARGCFEIRMYVILVFFARGSEIGCGINLKIWGVFGAFIALRVEIIGLAIKIVFQFLILTHWECVFDMIILPDYQRQMPNGVASKTAITLITGGGS